MKSTSYSKYALCIVILLTTISVCVPASSSAFTVPDAYTPLAPLPDVTSENLQLATSVDFNTYVKYAFNLLIAVAAVAAVFMITYGGFEYMTSDAVQGKSDGLSKIQNAIYGLLLILSSYLILRTVDPRFVNIPSTLVAPLNIKPANNISSWINNIQASLLAAQQGSIYKDQINTLLDQISDEKTIIDDYERQIQDLASTINDSVGGDAKNAHDVVDSCENGDYPPELSDQCSALFTLTDKQNELKGDMLMKQSVGLMTVQIEKCLNTGAVSQKTSDTCTAASQSEIANQTRTAVASLKDLGQTALAQKVIDYNHYAGTMVAINNELATLSSSPYYEALVSSVQQVNIAAGTAAGALLGGTKGAVAGFAVATVVDTAMTMELTEENQEQVTKVIGNIKKLVDQSNVQDPDISLLLEKQSQSIINQLGGTE